MGRGVRLEEAQRTSPSASTSWRCRADIGARWRTASWSPGQVRATLRCRWSTHIVDQRRAVHLGPVAGERAAALVREAAAVIVRAAAFVVLRKEPGRVPACRGGPAVRPARRTGRCPCSSWIRAQAPAHPFQDLPEAREARPGGDVGRERGTERPEVTLHDPLQRGTRRQRPVASHDSGGDDDLAAVSPHAAWRYLDERQQVARGVGHRRGGATSGKSSASAPPSAAGVRGSFASSSAARATIALRSRPCSAGAC